jgi:hypothetical protein
MSKVNPYQFKRRHIAENISLLDRSKQYITKASCFMLLREIITVCSESYYKHKKTVFV